jgi:hypothetical protein
VPLVPGGDDDGIINLFPLISHIRNGTIKLENQILMLALQKLESIRQGKSLVSSTYYFCGGGDDGCSVVKKEEIGIRDNDAGLEVIGARLSPVSTPSLSPPPLSIPLPPPHSSATPAILSPPRPQGGLHALRTCTGKYASARAALIPRGGSDRVG